MIRPHAHAHSHAHSHAHAHAHLHAACALAPCHDACETVLSMRKAYGQQRTDACSRQEGGDGRWVYVGDPGSGEWVWEEPGQSSSEWEPESWGGAADNEWENANGWNGEPQWQGVNSQWGQGDASVWQ